MSTDDPGSWAKLCRAQAALTSDPAARNLLLELASEYEAIQPRETGERPEDGLQDEIARSVRVATEWGR